MDALAQERLDQREERKAMLKALAAIAGGIAKASSKQTVLMKNRQFQKFQKKQLQKLHCFFEVRTKEQ